MGTFYGPSVSPDEIYHWLYKRKYRKNGHWVYEYDDGSLSEEGQYTKTREYQTQNGTPIHEQTTYKTNPNKLLNSERTDTTVSTDGKKAEVTDHKTIEKGKLHMLKNTLRRQLLPDPAEGRETAATGAKYFGKWAQKTVPKVAKFIKKNAPKVGKAIVKEAAKYNQRRAFNK